MCAHSIHLDLEFEASIKSPCSGEGQKIRSTGMIAEGQDYDRHSSFHLFNTCSSLGIGSVRLDVHLWWKRAEMTAPQRSR
jgi:hypothetical protein